MALDLSQQCDVQPNPYECPNAFVAEVRGGFGLIIHDDGGSVIEIKYCPSCGKQLPTVGEIADSRVTLPKFHPPRRH